jgi:hypothetical protein
MPGLEGECANVVQTDDQIWQEDAENKVIE